MPDSLSHYLVTIEVPVRWGDMDAFQHVNNTLYFRYFESARIAYFEQLAVADFLSSNGIGPILASTSCRFRFPVTYPDTLIVGARISQMGADRFVMEYRAVSQRHNKLAAEGEGLLVSYDYGAGRKAPIPDVVRTQVIAVEAQVGNAVAEMGR